MSAPALIQFRMFLERWDPSDRGDQLKFFRLLAPLEEEGIGDLRLRLLKAGAPREARRLCVEAAFYHPSKEWIEPLGTLLRRESDATIFQVGVRALGRLGPTASAVLAGLYTTGTVPEFKELLSLEILRTDPHQAFRYHLERLMEGSGNPRVANEAARELARLVNGDRLAELSVLARHEDPLIARHALKLLSLLHTPEAGAFFLDFLRETHAGVEADRELKELLSSLRNVPGPGLQEVLTPHLARAFGSADPETLEMLQGGDATRRSNGIALLRSQAQNALQAFLGEALALAAEARWTHWPTFLASTGEVIHQRGRRAPFILDACAQALAALAEEGLADRPSALEVIQAAYRAQTGREGVGRAFGSLVDPGDGEGLETLLSGQDGTLRAAALETLGARGEAALLPFLLRACRDPIVETAQRAMLSVGRTPGASRTVVDLLQSGNVDEVRLALNIAAVNRIEEVVPEVIRVLEAVSREDLVLACVETLGHIGAEAAGKALLGLLHSGQSQRLQVTLATSLRDLGHAEAALGLADRANQLRNPQVHLLAAEALIRAHGSPDRPLPAQYAGLLRQQIQGCWEDKNPWAPRHRLALALPSLWSEDPSLYQEMVTLVSNILSDKRCLAVWSALEQASAKAALKELVQKTLAIPGLS